MALGHRVYSFEAVRRVIVNFRNDDVTLCSNFEVAMEKNKGEIEKVDVINSVDNNSISNELMIRTNRNVSDRILSALNDKSGDKSSNTLNIRDQKKKHRHPSSRSDNFNTNSSRNSNSNSNRYSNSNRGETRSTERSSQRKSDRNSAKNTNEN